MTIEQRNEQAIKLLHPSMQLKTRQLIARCRMVGIRLLIVSGYRSIEEQNKLFAQGRTTIGEIVTNAKGGWSSHQYGVAVDVVPVFFGRPRWNNAKKFVQIGRIANAINMQQPIPIGDAGHITYGNLSISRLRAGEMPGLSQAIKEVRTALRASKEQIEHALNRPITIGTIGRRIRLRSALKMVERQLESLVA